VHAEDVLILAQSLRIILLANSRFCRLFSSNSSLGKPPDSLLEVNHVQQLTLSPSQALVLPSLFRTYCLADGRDPAIRDAIDYAYRRFASPPEPVIFLTIVSKRSRFVINQPSNSKLCFPFRPPLRPYCFTPTSRPKDTADG
jgi:hypothetical protein